MASITAFILSVWLGPRVIRWLAGLDAKQTIERAGFSSLYGAHAGKEKVPTMGGVLILATVIGSVLLWSDWTNRYILISCAVTAALGGIGFADDYLKLSKKNSKGLPGKLKLAGQAAIGVLLGIFLYRDSPAWQEITAPFLKDWFWALGPFYILFVAAVIAGASNAVNLTDGLDGLAIGSTLMIALTYGIFSYVTGHAQFSGYLQIPFILGAGELTVFCAAILGAGLGFLWFNSYPASVFMGDVGSLALGGAIGVVAILTKKELLLLIVGGIFVVEALSVMLQVAGYKFTKKRIFLMAPLHHHFQLQGIVESKVVIRFWIVSIILALAGLASLKLQ